jgi:hypothetical protein
MTLQYRRRKELADKVADFHPTDDWTDYNIVKDDSIVSPVHQFLSQLNKDDSRYEWRFKPEPRSKELEYWMIVALYLADCNAATASNLPRCSKADKKRFIDLAKVSIVCLEGGLNKQPRDIDTTLPVVIKRLKEAITEAEK